MYLTEKNQLRCVGKGALVTRVELCGLFLMHVVLFPVAAVLCFQGLPISACDKAPDRTLVTALLQHLLTQFHDMHLSRGNVLKFLFPSCVCKDLSFTINI